MTWPTADDLGAVLSYCPDTGEFRWKQQVSSRQKAGDQAGNFNNEGYLCIQYRSKEYKGHRIAWLLTHGEWPSAFIDHINGNPSDNRLANLRQATRNVNAQNQRRPQSSSKSGVLGVSRYRDKWKAQISNAGRVIYLGLFASTNEASAAYIRAKRQLHEGCVI